MCIWGAEEALSYIKAALDLECEQVVEVMTICVAVPNLCCDAESEWDLDKLKMHIVDRQEVR